MSVGPANGLARHCAELVEPASEKVFAGHGVQEIALDHDQLLSAAERARVAVGP